MSNSVAPAAAEAAAAEAFHQFTIESWTLYSIGVSATLLRTYARIRAVGVRNLQPADYLVWVGILFYTAQATLAYSIGNLAHGLANNSMTDAQRAALSPNDPEYQARVIGSKIQVAGWTTYSMLIWSLKLSMLSFYIQLTEGLGRPFRIGIYIGYALVMSSYIASVLTILLTCRPLHKYWQINPDPGNICQAAVSKPVIWVSFAANVSTDIYLISIPLPMLWNSRLRLIKKIASTIVLGAGIFVLVCAMLKSIFVLVDPVHGPQLAGEWGTREAFVAVITSNLPMILPLLKSLLSPFLESALRSSQKTYQLPTGFRTIGGGGGNSNNRSGRKPHTANHITANMTTFSESEERIVDEVKMNDLKALAVAAEEEKHVPEGILVENQVDVTHEDKKSQNSEPHVQRVPDSW